MEGFNLKRGGGNHVPEHGRPPGRTGGVDLGSGDILGWWEGRSEGLAASRRGGGEVLGGSGGF